MQTTYKPTTVQESGQYYPAIEHINDSVSIQIINEPKKTKIQALTAARKAIQTLIHFLIHGSELKPGQKYSKLHSNLFID